MSQEKKSIRGIIYASLFGLPLSAVVSAIKPVDYRAAFVFAVLLLIFMALNYYLR